MGKVGKWDHVCTFAIMIHPQLKPLKPASLPSLNLPGLAEQLGDSGAGMCAPFEKISIYAITAGDYHLSLHSLALA